MVTTRSSGNALFRGRLPLRGVRKRYNPTDWAHRHRLPDRQRKSVRVIAYRRRK